MEEAESFGGAIRWWNLYVPDFRCFKWSCPVWVAAWRAAASRSGGLGVMPVKGFDRRGKGYYDSPRGMETANASGDDELLEADSTFRVRLS